MHDIEKPFWWYELRDWLRQEFIRCMRERRAFPKERLSDHALIGSVARILLHVAAPTSSE